MTRLVSLVEVSTSRACSGSSPSGSGRSRDHLGELVGVDQVAVVAERDGAVDGGPEGRLRVLPGRGAGRGVARVADREVALERLERRLVEDLRDQAHVLVDQDLAAVADRDAGGLLPAVLQGVQPEVGQLGDVLARGPDTEHAAGVLRALVLGVEGHGQTAVAARPLARRLGHGSQSTGARARVSHPRRTPDVAVRSRRVPRSGADPVEGQAGGGAGGRRERAARRAAGAGGSRRGRRAARPRDRRTPGRWRASIASPSAQQRAAVARRPGVAGPADHVVVQRLDQRR